MFRWAAGLVVLVCLSLDLLKNVLIRLGWCYWSPALTKAMAPNKVGDSYPWIVITGCTDGIGSELIQKLAAEWPKNPILLIGRNTQKLDTVATGLLKGLHGRKVEKLQLDFSEPKWLTPEVQDRLSSLEVGLLANVAGAAQDEWVEGITPERITDLVRVNLRPPLVLCRLCLPNMVKRKAGVLLQVGSLATAMSSPGSSVYTSTKQGLRTFSEALQTEVRSFGILVQCWEPGLVLTKLLSKRKLNDPTISWTACTSYELVDYGVNCLKTGSPSWIFPFGYTPTAVSPYPLHALVSTFSRFMPPHLWNLFEIREAFSVF